MSDFADWYVEGEAIPVAHPLPWVYAEVYFPRDTQIVWRVLNYKDGTATEETFELTGREEYDLDV